MKDALHHIVTSIVADEKAVEIHEETQEEGTVNYIITVAPEDIGKIIGKSGKVIRAIRNVMKIPAMKQGKRIMISLNG